MNSKLYLTEQPTWAKTDVCSGAYNIGDQIYPPPISVDSFNLLLGGDKTASWQKLMKLERKRGLWDIIYDGPDGVKLRVGNSTSVDENMLGILKTMRNYFVTAGYTEGSTFRVRPYEIRASARGSWRQGISCIQA